MLSTHNSASAFEHFLFPVIRTMRCIDSWAYSKTSEIKPRKNRFLMPPSIGDIFPVSVSHRLLEYKVFCWHYRLPSVNFLVVCLSFLSSKALVFWVPCRDTYPSATCQTICPQSFWETPSTTCSGTFLCCLEGLFCILNLGVCLLLTCPSMDIL